MIPICQAVVLRLGDLDEDTHGHPRGDLGARLHLALCGDCTRYWRQLRAVRAVLGAPPAEPVSAETRAALTARFRAWHAGRRKGEA